MSGVLRPEDIFHQELEGTGVPAGSSGLLETVALLHATGNEIHAPASLRARRGALVAAGHGTRALLWRPDPRWRGMRAMVLAAALTMLMAVGVGAAATFGGGWLRDLRSDERPPVRLVLPPRESANEASSDHPNGPPARAASEPDDMTKPHQEDEDAPEADDGDSSESGDRESDDTPEADDAESATTDQDEVEVEADPDDTTERDSEELGSTESDN